MLSPDFPLRRGAGCGVEIPVRGVLTVAGPSPVARQGAELPVCGGWGCASSMFISIHQRKRHVTNEPLFFFGNTRKRNFGYFKPIPPAHYKALRQNTVPISLCYLCEIYEIILSFHSPVFFFSRLIGLQFCSVAVNSLRKVTTPVTVF